MEFKKMTFIFCMSAITLSTFAQFKKPFSISVDYGTRGIASELNEKWPVRQDLSSSSSYYGSSSVNINSMLNYFSVLPEYQFYKDRLNVSTGLRFTNLYSDMTKYDVDNGGYFYLRVKSEETSTEYAKVKSITESTNYLSIPLNLKFIVIKYYQITFNAKLSAELGYKLNSNTNIDFKQSIMESFENKVLSDLDIKINPFYSLFGASIGTMYEINKKLNIGFDLLLPSFYSSKGNSSLFNNTDIVGAQFYLNYEL